MVQVPDIVAQGAFSRRYKHIQANNREAQKHEDQEYSDGPDGPDFSKDVHASSFFRRKGKIGYDLSA